MLWCSRGTLCRVSHSSACDDYFVVVASLGAFPEVDGVTVMVARAVVEEEEEPGADGQDDVVEVPPPPKPKRGPGRPPKHKKTESVVQTAAEVDPVNVPAKKGHARTRSKTARSRHLATMRRARGRMRTWGRTRRCVSPIHCVFGLVPDELPGVALYIIH